MRLCLERGDDVSWDGRRPGRAIARLGVEDYTAVARHETQLLGVLAALDARTWILVRRDPLVVTPRCSGFEHPFANRASSVGENLNCSAESLRRAVGDRSMP